MQCEWFKTYTLAFSVRWVLDQFFLGQCADKYRMALCRFVWSFPTNHAGMFVQRDFLAADQKVKSHDNFAGL